MVYQLKVSLMGIEPEIWRRLRVPADIKLSKLNHVIQAAMGWTNSHLHQFVVGPIAYSDPEFELEIEHEDEFHFRLVDIAPRPPSAFVYEYDFGDSWEQLVVVEEYWARGDRDPTLPLCLEGARACPPEDVGGKSGYEEFLRVLRDPEDEQHEDMVTWVGGAFDPEAFDVASYRAAARSRPEFMVAQKETEPGGTIRCQL